MSDDATPPATTAETTPPAPVAGGAGRKLVRVVAYLLAGLVVLAAVALVGLRLLLPELGHYRPAIEGWLSRVSDRQVEIGTIDARWRGWTPVFRLRDVRLAGGEAPVDPSADDSVRLADLTFSLDLLDLLRSGAFHPREISASGVSFVVTQQSDGTLAVAELGFGQDAAGGPRTSDGLARWMLDQADLSLYASRIVWIDERLGIGPLPLDGVTLTLERAGDRRQVSGSFEPSDTGRIDFAIEIAGDPLTSSWTGTAYLAAVDVDLARLGLDAGAGESTALSGVVSGRVWSTWEDGRPVEATGTIRAQSPSVVRGKSRHGVDEVSASFKAERRPEGWTMAARDLVVAVPGGSWPASGIDAAWKRPGEGRDGTIIVGAEFARIEDLVALVVPDDATAANATLKALAEAAPSGTLEDVQLSVPVADRIDFERVRASGRFTNLALGPQIGAVSVDGASGRFEASGQGVVADVDTGRLRVNFPDRLERPLQGEKLAGTFAAVSTPEGLRVRFDEASIETPAGTVTANGRLLAPRDEGGPELDFALSIGDSRISAVRDLVGDLLMPEPALRWLERAAPFGDVREARIAFRGRLSSAPPGDGEGAIEAVATLFVPVFSYASGWPEVTGLSAEVRFGGRRFDARIESGRILKSVVREAMVTIEDVSAEVPVVRVEGRVEGTSADAVRFLAESPLRARFAPLFNAFAVHGDSTIDVEIAVPLKGRDRSVAASGRIALDHNRIDGPGLGGGLAAVNGVIAFRNDAVESDGVTATWLGEPIHALVGASPQDPNATRVTFGGRVTRRLLAAYLHDAGMLDAPTPEGSALLARVRGDAAWTATLDVPAKLDAAPTTLRVASDLTGLAMDLPPPFGKTSGTTRMLGIDARLGPGPERVTEVHLDAAASAVLRLVRDAGGFRIERGAIRIGAGRAVLPDAPTISVQGEMPALDTARWQAVLEDAAALRPSEADPSRPEPWPEVSIDAGSMTAFGVRFPDTRVRATRAAQGGWQVDLDGARVQGSVRFPRDPGPEPVIADFERLVYAPDAAGTGRESSGLDPRTVPTVSFTARQFILGDHDLGQVGFTTVPSEHGLDITELQVRADSFQGNGTGSWTLAGGEHTTEFALRVYGDDLRRMLETVGFDGRAVAGGTTDLKLRGSWPGAPADFAIDRLAGVMNFLSTEGRLTQVQPGLTGHVFGLLTITSLPRRLLLDFGDLFREGIGYDRIEGSFAIENGNAYTDDLFVESDPARFEVVGRTGLVHRDYDQIVTITPKVSSSLPLVPIWLAQKLLDRNLFDKAFAYQYTIAGTWDEPQMELVRTAAPAEESAN